MMASDSVYKLLRNGTVLIHDERDLVHEYENCDILIKGDRIVDIGRNVRLPADTNSVTIDCSGKIISPGFIDTHHHLWQTQLKGRSADVNLLDYFPSGQLPCFFFTPDDTFWGQLTGCLEAIDAGTTFVLDHMHGAYTREHAEAGLKATVESGLRVVSAHGMPNLVAEWDDKKCTPYFGNEPLAEWNMAYIEDNCKKQPIQGRVDMGFGFDLWYLPEDVVKKIWARVRGAGVKVITSHVGNNGVFYHDCVDQMDHWGLLAKDVVASHATNLDARKKKVLYDAGIYSSSTPETECQMGMGWPVALDHHVHGSLGIDCHANNSSSILIQARMLLQQIRQREAQIVIAKGQVEKTPCSSTVQAFNLATIGGARAVGMESDIGSIAIGKKADLVIFDPTNSPSMLCSTGLTAVLRHSDIRDIDMVIIDGVVRKQAGKLLPVEVDGKPLPYSDVAKSTLTSRKEIYERLNKADWNAGREMIINLFQADRSKIIDTKSV